VHQLAAEDLLSGNYPRGLVMADELCSNCRLPLDSNREQVRRISQVTYCQLCFDLYGAVADRPGLVQAQRDWSSEQQNRRRLMPGSDYFSK
jgi:hypothetical protein